MSGRQNRVLVASLLALVLFATPEAAQGVSASAAQPQVQPLVGLIVPAAAPALVAKARLTLNPAAHTVVVSFGSAYARRLATPQEIGDEFAVDAAASDWVKAAPRKRLDSKGRATFKVDVVGGVSYRVVLSKSGSRPARRSGAATLDDQWNSDFSDDFEADAIDETSWSDRLVGEQVQTRLCSLPSRNIDLRFLGDSEFNAGIIKHRGDAFFDAVVARANPIAQARLEQSLAAAKRLRTKRQRLDAISKANYQFKITYNCPHGAFENSMVSTMDKAAGVRVNTAQPGIVSARVKFPAAQGMHTGIWLQSFVPGGGEIDIAETFGYGSALANFIHVPSTGKMYRPGNRIGLTRKGGAVLKSKTASRKWWDSYHEVSVEWTATSFVFRVDATVTNTIKLTPGNAEYYLILSLLSSDWELPRLARPIGKGKPVTDVSNQKLLVDWVRIWSRQS